MQISNFKQIIFIVGELCFNLWHENKNIKSIDMKGLLQNLGLFIIILSAIILMIAYFTGNVNNNFVLGSTLCLGIIGLVTHIFFNKRITD